MITLIVTAIVGAVIWVALTVISRYEDALIKISHSHTDSADELRDIADAARHPKNPLSPRVGKRY